MATRYIVSSDKHKVHCGPTLIRVYVNDRNAFRFMAESVRRYPHFPDGGYVVETFPESDSRLPSREVGRFFKGERK